MEVGEFLPEQYRRSWTDIASNICELSGIFGIVGSKRGTEAEDAVTSRDPCTRTFGTNLMGEKFVSTADCCHVAVLGRTYAPISTKLVFLKDIFS